MNPPDTVSILSARLPCSDGVSRTVWYDARGAAVYVVVGFACVHGHCLPPYPAPAELFVFDEDEMP
jgi:hypothetical protein